MDADKPAESKGRVAVESGLQPAVPGGEAAKLRSGRYSTLPASARLSPQLNALCQRAATGAVEDIKRLAQWSALVEHEAEVLRKRLRKQQHDFATLFEIVGQTSARALDVGAMQNYLLRTVSGHFATPRLVIVRRIIAEDRTLTCSAAQGVREPKVTLAADSPLCQFALDRRFCFFLKELPPAAANSSEAAALKELGLDLVVPLVQDVEAPGAVLEGLLLLGPRLAGLPFSEEDLEFLNILAKMLAICLRNEALYRRSIIDDLTGVASRGHFEAQLSQELNRILTYGHKSLGLVMLDIDHFKDVNDTYGHPSGDKVLQALARLMVAQVRNVDLVARYGGEEFCIILLEIDRPKVLEVANRLRAAVEEMKVTSTKGEELRITASFGLACFPDDATDRSMLIQLADEALYRSKNGGRNRISMAEPGSGLNRSVVAAPSTSAAALPMRTTSLAPPGGPMGVFGSRSGPRTTSVAADLERIQEQQRALLYEKPLSAPPPPSRKKPSSERRRRKGTQAT